MRIAFVVTEFPALSETFVLNQITGLMDQGHEIDIHADRPRRIAAHPDYFTYKLASRVYYRIWIPKNTSKRILKALWLFATNAHKNMGATLRSMTPTRIGSGDALLRQFYEAVPYLGRPRYDAIICHFGENGIRLANLKRLGAVQGRLLTFFHGADITRYVIAHSERVYDELFREGALFLPISERWKHRLIELGCAPAKIRVHHMGIDTARFVFQPRQEGADSHLRLVSVARLVEKKGLRYAIDAVSQLQLPTGMKLTYEIIGDGPLHDGLTRQVAELGLQDRVKLSGWQDQAYVVAALAASHVLLAPSVTAKDGDQEGIPVSLMEAMAAGLPVVSTFHSGIPELIEDGVSGLLVNEADPAALASAIERLLADPALRLSIALGARALVESRWNIKALNQSLALLCASPA